MPSSSRAATMFSCGTWLNNMRLTTSRTGLGRRAILPLRGFFVREGWLDDWITGWMAESNDCWGNGVPATWFCGTRAVSAGLGALKRLVIGEHAEASTLRDRKSVV